MNTQFELVCESWDGSVLQERFNLGKIVQNIGKKVGKSAEHAGSIGAKIGGTVGGLGGIGTGIASGLEGGVAQGIGTGLMLTPFGTASGAVVGGIGGDVARDSIRKLGDKIVKKGQQMRVDKIAKHFKKTPEEVIGKIRDKKYDVWNKKEPWETYWRDKRAYKGAVDDLKNQADFADLWADMTPEQLDAILIGQGVKPNALKRMALQWSMKQKAKGVRDSAEKTISKLKVPEAPATPYPHPGLQSMR